MNLFKHWSNLNYPNPFELQNHLPHLTTNDVNDFYKSLKLKKNKVKVKKNENEMKKIQIDFTKSILDFYN